MKNKLSVTIAIPAYNEGRNIYDLLQSILSQKQTFFLLEKIMVLSDGSTDNTVREAKRIKDKRLQVIGHNSRTGKIRMLNFAFNKNKSDVLIQLDADVILKGKETLDNLILPFIKDEKTSIVYGNQVPFEAKTYVGKLAYFGFYAWEEAKKMVNADRYNCFGCITAFSKTFLKKYQLPETGNYYTEDTYSFYYAKKYNHQTFFAPNAVALFTLPSNMRDYSHQMNRYLTTAGDMKVIFGESLVKKHETIGTFVKSAGLVKYSLKNPPHLSVGYIFLQSWPKLRSLFHKEQINWEQINSSKKNVNA